MVYFVPSRPTRATFAAFRACRGFRDVQDRYGDAPGDVRRDLVHGVRADHDEIRAGLFQVRRCVAQDSRALIPFARGLTALDLVEIHAVHQHLRRVQAAQLALDDLVDDLVIGHRALPAHAADHADGLHERASPDR